MNGDKADQARAAFLMLLMTHPEIAGDPSQMGMIVDGGYLFWVTIEGKDAPIWIYISRLFESDEGHYADTQYVGYVDGDDVMGGIELVVYQAAFQSIAHLYHVIGHEGCHVYDLIITEGNIFSYELEFNGYMWNFKHRYGPIPYPSEMLDDLFANINYFMPAFSKGAIPI